MLCCLNPNCQNPLNPDSVEHCFSCGTKLVASLGDRYRPVYPLASGGLSQTFLAQEKDTQASYLVQQLALPGSNQYYQISAYFHAKAERLAQIGEHPQISSLSAYFTQGDYFYLVQPTISGQTLRQEFMQAGAFSEQQIWDILSQILPLLYFIHKQQIVHGNIHLENIIRRIGDDRLMLINFDLTKQLLAPEHSSGDDFKTEMNLDFYDLGVACLHLLSGINPYSWQTERDRAWIANWQQYPLLQAISSELTQVIDKLLQKSPRQDDLAAARSPQQMATSTLAPKLAPRETTALVTRQVETPIVPAMTTPTAVTTPSAPVKPSKWSRILGSCFLLLLALVAYLYYWQQEQVITLTGHTDEVNTVAFTPDGKEFATGSDDRTIIIWDANSLRDIRTLKGHLDWVYSVGISNDGQTLVSGSKDNTVKVWNLYTGREIRTLRGHQSYVNYVAISPDGQKVASASYDKTAKIWDLHTGENITLTGHTSEVLTVAISPDGQKLVTGSSDKTIKIWDFKSARELRTLRGHKDAVWSVAISPDSQQLYSVSDGRTIKVWNLNTGREIRTIAGHTADINLVAVSPNGQKIATCSDDKTIKLWNIISGAELATFKGHTAAVWAVAFSPDGRKLVSTSEDSTVKIWHVPQ